MAKGSKLGTWLGIAAACGGFAAFLYFRVGYLHRQGAEVFWLAELFAPVAFFSVLIVTFVEKLVGKAPGPAAKRARR
jgi:hypothetical protein